MKKYKKYFSKHFKYNLNYIKITNMKYFNKFYIILLVNYLSNDIQDKKIIL